MCAPSEYSLTYKKADSTAIHHIIHHNIPLKSGRNQLLTYERLPALSPQGESGYSALLLCAFAHFDIISYEAGNVNGGFRKNVSKNVSFRGCDCEVSGQRIVPLEARLRSAKNRSGTKFKSRRASFSLSTDVFPGPPQERYAVRTPHNRSLLFNSPTPALSSPRWPQIHPFYSILLSGNM